MHDETRGKTRTTFTELVSKKAAEFNSRFDAAGREAQRLRDRGELRLVDEFVMQPHRGHGFTIRKGQVLRYELIDGPQILDTAYLVASRPTAEWADIYATAQYAALTLAEGTHYYSNTPYMRPLLTLITDTVDHERLKALHGEMAEHSFVYPAGRCHAAMHEQAFGEPNLSCCDFNLLQAIVDVAGEEVALRTPIPNAFMHFQPMAYDQKPMNYSMFSSKDVFRRGDHVELLAHHDLHVAVSLCPSGDQHDMSGHETLTTYPVAVKVFEGPDGPLDTAPDPEFRSMTHEDFIRGGCRSTPSGRVGDRTAPTAFTD